MWWTLMPVTNPLGGGGPEEQLATRRTIPNRVASRPRMSLRSAVGFFLQERDVVFATLVGGFADHRRPRCLDRGHQQVGIDLTAAQIGVTVATRARLVFGIVAVHQIDATG